MGGPPFICMPPSWRYLSQPRDPPSKTGLSNQLIQPVAFTQPNLDIHSLDKATRLLFYSVSFINPQYLQDSGTKVHIFLQNICGTLQWQYLVILCNLSQPRRAPPLQNLNIPIQCIPDQIPHDFKVDSMPPLHQVLQGITVIAGLHGHLKHSRLLSSCNSP